MKNSKLILTIILILITAYLLGGWIMAMFYFLMKIIFGIMGLALLIGGFYIGKNWNKNK